MKATVFLVIDDEDLAEVISAWLIVDERIDIIKSVCTELLDASTIPKEACVVLYASLETFKKIAKRLSATKRPVVVLSTTSMHEHLAHELGFETLLSPLHLDKLPGLIERLCIVHAQAVSSALVEENKNEA